MAGLVHSPGTVKNCLANSRFIALCAGVMLSLSIATSVQAGELQGVKRLVSYLTNSQLKTAQSVGREVGVELTGPSPARQSSWIEWVGKGGDKDAWVKEVVFRTPSALDDPTDRDGSTYSGAIIISIKAGVCLRLNDIEGAYGVGTVLPPSPHAPEPVREEATENFVINGREVVFSAPREEGGIGCITALGVYDIPVRR